MPDTRHNKTSFFLIAGEPSGDVLGGRLIKALVNDFGAGIRISGIGGSAMLEAGLPASLFPMEELSVMGVFEVLPKVRNLKKRIEQTANEIVESRPDAVVSIDSPDFCFRVASRVKAQSGADAPKIIHYVAPSVWAWRPGRAKKIARFLDGLMCLLPFEPPYFEREGLKAEFVGHPMVETGILDADPNEYRKEKVITDRDIVTGLLPGSRKSEISRTGSVLYKTAQKLGRDYKYINFIIPTLPHMKDFITASCPGLPGQVHIETDPDKKYQAFAACDIALATSGTVGLELAIAGVPHIIGYRMNELTWRVMKKIVRVKYAHLANIILDKEAVPEFIQKKCEPELLADAALSLLRAPKKRQQQKADFKKVREIMKVDSETSPSEKAAGFIKEIISGRN